MCTDRFVEAVYRAILGREPGPEGLQGRSSYFRNADYPVGVERTIRALLGFPEFLAKQQASDDLDNEVLSPSTRERSVARRRPPYPIVLVRFRLLPRAIPTFYLEASDTDTQPRVLLHLRYLDDIISNFICGSSHFHMFAEEIDHENHFVAQISDQSADILGSIGYCFRSQSQYTELITDVHFWYTRGYFFKRK